MGVRQGVVYDPAHGTMLDLYEPDDQERDRPCVVVIHGGGFRFQSRLDDGIVRICEALSRRGVMAASIDHRMLNDDPQPSTAFAHLVDALPGVSSVIAPTVV